MIVDPLTRLSKHFTVADFLGNHTVYTKGVPNQIEGTAAEVEFKLANARTLCEEILEPVLEHFGPLSISYGYISPELSRMIVTYQDPNKPSHHRWDLGAAADICVHDWVETQNGFEDADCDGAPVALALGLSPHIDYSRLITYSESPYLCVAASAQEVAAQRPRKAFYENRFLGTPRQKPDYRTYASEATRQRAYSELHRAGLPVPWRGAGYPTYHGGGRRQYQHTRISEYTMLSDWLFDLQSIATGAKMIPALNLESVQDALGAAGMAYDYLIKATGYKRLTILSGYIPHTSPSFNDNNDWRTGRFAFQLMLPDGAHPRPLLAAGYVIGLEVQEDDDGTIWLAGEVERTYSRAGKMPA